MSHQPPKPQSDYLGTTYPLPPSNPGITAPAGLPPISPTPTPRRQPRRFTKKRLIWTIATIITLLLLSVGGWIGYTFVHNAVKATNGNLLSLLSNTKLKGEDTGRVNLLLAGNSADDPGHGGSQLTDSIIIASIDTKNNSAFLLSIPRDTWVNTPGYGHQRINAVYPEGGMDLLQKVVEADFGLTINYQVLVNYSAFKQAVDALGGITVTIQSPDTRGIYDPNIAVDTGGGVLRLKNGAQTLDGQTALNLARARNDPVPPNLFKKYGAAYGLPHGDFDRAANQRLMLVALKDKAASLSTLSNPLKITALLDSIGDNVKTDFTPAELRRLYELGKKIQSTGIQSISLQDSEKDINLITDYTTNEGAQVLVPSAGLDDFSEIKRYIKQLTSNDPIVKENARIVVLNGSGVAGLAKSQAATLEAKNFNVTDYDNAPATVTANQILGTNTTKPSTLAQLKTLLGVKATTTNPAITALYPDADYIIILGTTNTPTPTPN
jgi:LCP family protein required for cell wall assembly